MTQYLGLSQKEAQKNRVEYGDNLLEGGQKKSALKILLAQFGDLMTLILLCSTILSMAMGEKWRRDHYCHRNPQCADGIFSGVSHRTSLQKLGELAAPSATVIRDGHSRVIPAKEVTIGDLVVLKAGDRVPADCRIVENSELSIDESLLTGESVPVEKGCTDHRTNDYSEQVCAFMGTIVLRGHGKAVVYRIGEETRMGEIAVMLDSIEQQQTPLQKKLDQLGKGIAIGCLVICALVSGVGILRGEPVMEMLITGISLGSGQPSRRACLPLLPSRWRFRSTGWSRRMR